MIPGFITESIVCDVCKKEYSYTNFMEIQEFKEIFVFGGFDSVFGDGSKKRLDICQHCLKEKLGEYFVDIEDEEETVE